MKQIKSNSKEDTELLVVSCTTIQKLKHVHNPFYLLLPNIVCSMNFDTRVQVDQEKIKRQSINFSIHKYLDLSSIILLFFLDVT